MGYLYRLLGKTFELQSSNYVLKTMTLARVFMPGNICVLQALWDNVKIVLLGSITHYESYSLYTRLLGKKV